MIDALPHISMRLAFRSMRKDTSAGRHMSTRAVVSTKLHATTTPGESSDTADKFPAARISRHRASSSFIGVARCTKPTSSTGSVFTMFRTPHS